jgi:hypothetical protein
VPSFPRLSTAELVKRESKMISRGAVEKSMTSSAVENPASAGLTAIFAVLQVFWGWVHAVIGHESDQS